MFLKDDEIIEFLEETMELHIPEELLKDKKETLDYIEDKMNLEIPKTIRKKKKIMQFIEKTNQDFQTFYQQKRSLAVLKNFFFSALFLLPLLIFFYFVTVHSNYAFLNSLKPFVITAMVFLLIISSILLFLVLKNQKIRCWKWRRRDFLTFGIFAIFSLLVAVNGYMLYGKVDGFRKFFIQEVMSTTNHQYLANIFFNSRMIENSLSVPLEDSDSQSALYEFEPIQFDVNDYANPYEKEILTKENPDDIYKIIKVEGTLRDGVQKYSGYMAVVYDPSKVKIGTSVGAGVDNQAFGQILAQISKNYQAKVAINAGGFYDPTWTSNGGIPHGLVIQDGKVLTEYTRGIDSGGLIGFDENNQLILKRMSREEAIDAKIRDAVDWGPYLIVNGVNYFRDETTKWACARTVIGQRKDGIVLLLVIDGDQPHSRGASYSDLADIMERYGAYNAANLDGGTSTSMVENHEYINIPFNGQRRTIRSLPNAWIVVE